MRYTLASLLVTRHVAESLKIVQCDITNGVLEALVITPKQEEKSLSLNVGLHWQDIASNYQRAYNLLISSEFITNEEALLKTVLETKTLNDLEYSFIQGTSISYKLHRGQNQIIPYNYANATEELYKLNAFRCLCEGYSIEEVKGVRIKVHTPSGRIRNTSEFSCDCTQWVEAQKNKTGACCDHVNLVRQYTQARARWQKAGFATLV